MGEGRWFEQRCHARRPLVLGKSAAGAQREASAPLAQGVILLGVARCLAKN